MKHLPIEKMMSKDHHLLPEQVADYAVGNSDRGCGHDKVRLITDLINKCIDDTIKYEYSEEKLLPIIKEVLSKK